MNNEWALKKQIVEVGHKLWDKNFVAANDGNITIRLNDKEFLTTPTGISKNLPMNQESLFRSSRRIVMLTGSFM